MGNTTSSNAKVVTSPVIKTNNNGATLPSKSIDEPIAVIEKPQQIKSNTIVSEANNEDPIDILFQFIPYYAQGNTINDGIVRSSLSSLSVEDIDRKDVDGNTLLLVACQYRCADLVRIMLNKGADPNLVNKCGACGLHFACYKETLSKSIVKILLQNGANPEVSETTYGCNPLHYAASTGDLELCKMLLSFGAFVGTRDYYNYTCVDYAREAHFPEIATFLQKKMLSTASAGGGEFAKFAGKGLYVPKFSDDITVPAVTPVTREKSPMGLPTNIPSNTLHDEWSANTDPASNATYYINLNNGSCLWEDEYLQLMKNLKENQSKDMKAISSPMTDAKASDVITPLKVNFSEVKVINSVDDLVFYPQTPGPSMEAGAVKKALEELRLASEKILNEEREVSRKEIGEKDGAIAKLESRVDFLNQQKVSLQAQIKELEVKSTQSHVSEREKISYVRKCLQDAQEKSADLNATCSKVKTELVEVQNELESLQSSFKNLESGRSEILKQEQRLAQERADAQQKRDTMYAAEIEEKERQIKESKQNATANINSTIEDLKTMAEGPQLKREMIMQQLEEKLNQLSRDDAESRSTFAQELSKARQLAAENLKRAVESEERSQGAIEMQKSMEQDIKEAAEVQKFNAQLHKDLAREQVHRKRLHNEIEDMKGRIRVYVRVRPFSTSENEKNCKESVIKDSKTCVCVKADGEAKKAYDFDQVFGGSMTEGNSQADVFRDTKHLMMSVIDGYNVCIFAYGQTGSGKTFTMIGATDIGKSVRPDGEFDDLAGIAPRAIMEIFRLLNERSAQITFEVEVQMFQLYRDSIEDLLVDDSKPGKLSSSIKSMKGGVSFKSTRKIAVNDDLDSSSNSLESFSRKGGGGGPLKITLAEHSPTGMVFVQGATTMLASTPQDVLHIFSQGALRRTTGSTNMNSESSRSHLICIITVRLTNRRTNATISGKLSLVDLAGSERLDKSGASGEMMKEAQSINKSLSAIGDVIAALTSGADHVPYRNHPLTMLMSDSIGGNAKTLMFVNCSPADYNVSETTSSLGFAHRCKDVKNAVGGNPIQLQQMAALKKELAKLQKDNKSIVTGGGQLQRPV